MNLPEVHLFIIWEKGRFAQNEILADIKENFGVLEVTEVTWSKEYFSENLTRFYGMNLPKNSNKEKHCGKGPFLLVVVRDFNPIYRLRSTSSGSKVVNVNMYDSKEMYRSWTGGGHKIHATNSSVETQHDLTLLKGKNIEDYLSMIEANFDGRIGRVSEDIIGYNGWTDISQLFYILNSTVNYAVLRNFECLPDDYNMTNHGDIDLLTDSYFNLKCVANAKEVYKDSCRVQNLVKIDQDWVQFDFRFVGDDYYDTKWQRDMLRSRLLDKGGFYRLNDKDYFFSLLYHALIHKKTVGQDYFTRLKSFADVGFVLNFEIPETTVAMHSLLKEYMEVKGYAPSFPKDYSVYFNSTNAGLDISLREKIGKEIKLQKSRLRRLFKAYENKVS